MAQVAHVTSAVSSNGSFVQLKRDAFARSFMKPEIGLKRKNTWAIY